MTRESREHPGDRSRVPLMGSVPWATAGMVAVAWIVLGLPQLRGVLLLDRAAVGRGEIWRLVTGHWVHFSYPHIIVDTVLLAICAGWIELRNRRLLAAILGTAPLAISSALLVFAPKLQVYGGLSGIAAAALACCCVMMWRERRSPIGLAVIILLGLKTAMESAGASIDLGVLPPGVRLEPVSHLAGLVCGILVATIRSATPDNRPDPLGSGPPAPASKNPNCPGTTPCAAALNGEQ